MAFYGTKLGPRKFKKKKIYIYIYISLYHSKHFVTWRKRDQSVKN